jgi:hypothetical protein
MLYDAAVLKAEEDEHTTPIKNKRHEELSSDGERINLNASTGRSRSLDSQTVRRTSRRNSLCISSEFGRGYRSPKAERDVKAYIASKSRRGFGYSANAYTEGTKDNLNNEKNAFNGVTTFDSLGTKDLLSGLTIDTGGKSSTNMASWENEMRSNLADIQKKYKEKYKELYRLDHQAKRMEARNKKRPSVGKECAAESNILPNHSKSPIVSPKKHCRPDGNTRNCMDSNPLPPSKPLPLPLHPDILDQTRNICSFIYFILLRQSQGPMYQKHHLFLTRTSLDSSVLALVLSRV